MHVQDLDAVQCSTSRRELRRDVKKNGINHAENFLICAGTHSPKCSVVRGAHVDERSECGWAHAEIFVPNVPPHGRRPPSVGRSPQLRA
jgi:hypothetical protein